MPAPTPLPTGVERLRSRVVAALPLVFAAALSAAFIARVAFVVNDEVFFSLFDDQMISMRYAQNLVEGHGLVWNPGEPPVEGYSNLLWTLWMALLHALGPPAAKASLLVMLSGAVLLVLNAALARRVAAELAPELPLAGPAACWLVALDHSLSHWTLRGFEVGLIACQILLAVHLALGLARDCRPRRLAALAVVMALGVLTRDDTVPAWLVVCGFVAWRVPHRHPRRLGLFLAGVVVATFLAHVIARHLYYGAPLPNTYYLKLHGVPALFRFRRGLVALAKTFLHVLPLPLALAGAALARRPRHPGALLLAALFLVHCLYSIHVGGDIVEHELLANRFITSGLPALLVLSGLGLAGLIASLSAPAAGAAAPASHDAAPRSRRAPVLAAWGLAAVACAWNARTLVLAGGMLELRLARIAAALLAAVLVTALACGRLRARTTAIAGALVLAAQAPPLLRWATSGALLAHEDSLGARYGLALASATSPDARIAVTWAGAIPYFSRRRSIDLFGVCDPVIARSTPHPGPYAPGHDRWDHAYSVGQLRPDVIAQVTEDTPELLSQLRAWGYDRVGPEAFVLRGSPAVDRAAMEHAVCAIPWDTAEVWGHFGDSPAAWGERWRRECH